MTNIIRAVLAVAVLGGAPAAASAQDANPAVAAASSGAVTEFRRLRSEGVAAAQAGDLAVAAARLAEADALIPNHPGLILLRARVAAGAGTPGEAVAQLDRYSRAGLTMNLSRDAALSSIAGAPGFAEAAARIEANAAPVGADRLTPLAQLPGTLLVESLVRDEARNRWLVSQVAGRTIVALADDGAVTPFLQPDEAISGVLGLAFSPDGSALWAATAPVPPAVHGRTETPPATALVKIDPASGAVLARHPAPERAATRSFGDLIVAADGTVYVSDSAGGDILQLRPGAEALEVLLPGGTLGSPQGLAMTPDGAGLIVADYSSGLWRIDRTSGAAALLAAPPDASLVGIDGLTTDGVALYGFQNGVAPQRVLKLTPDAGWSGIAAAETLAANLPLFDEPTTGLVRNGELVFVSRSQWSDFDGEGALRAGVPEPAVIARLRLDQGD